MTQKIFVLKCDGEEFVIDEAVALQSQTIKHMIEDDCADDNIPLPNVTAPILAKVIEYCKRHVDPQSTDDDLKAFDDQLVKVDHPAMLFELIMAANYLDIKNLLDLTCQAVADMIKEKTPEEIRTLFNIQNDFTPAEEDAIRKKTAWAFR